LEAVGQQPVNLLTTPASAIFSSIVPAAAGWRNFPKRVPVSAKPRSPMPWFVSALARKPTRGKNQSDSISTPGNILTSPFFHFSASNLNRFHQRS